MKQRLFVAGVVIITLLSIALSRQFDVGTVRAQEGGGSVTAIFDEASLPSDLALTLLPYNPPIVIPASGGTFQYAIAIENLKVNSVKFDTWTSITKPDGSTVDPAGGPFRAYVPGGWSASRDDLTQEILAGDPPGIYTYNAHVGRFPDRILATESFTFEKLASTGWYAQSSGTSDWFFDIHFADANNGWAVGQTNEIVHTSNGGDTWTAQSTPIFVNLWAVFAVDAQHAWAAGSGGGAVLLHTNDGGDTWVQQDAGGTSTWEGIFFLDENNGWIVGGKPFDFTAARRVIKHTTDGGATWETQYSVSNEAPLNAVYFVDANHGWAVGDGSGILHTSDGGATWIEQTSGTIDYFEGVFFTDTLNGWAVGRDGVLVHTTNGGATWDIQNLGSDNSLTGVYFADENTGWVSGSNQDISQAIILRTDDGGATWHNQDPGPVSVLYNVVFVDANNGWAAGSNGVIVHTDTGGE